MTKSEVEKRQPPQQTPSKDEGVIKFQLDFTSDKKTVADAIRRSLLIDEPPPPPIVYSPALASPWAISSPMNPGSRLSLEAVTSDRDSRGRASSTSRTTICL